MRESPEKEYTRLVLEKVPILDVRAPVEFADGMLPGSTNLPLLTDDERAAVGTIYKQKGSEAAVALGHSLVSGQVKERRILAWRDWLEQRPGAVITCFRGGLRSGIAQQWLAERSMARVRLEGGYKGMRRFLLKQVEDAATRRWIAVAGPTGSGKSALLQAGRFPALDLEALARHRGSAFGALPDAQPSQASFENALGAELTVLAHRAPACPWLMEDESRMVGSRVVPEALFSALRSAPAVLIEESLDRRVENVFAEYVLGSDLGGARGEAAAAAKLESYRQALRKISGKLGGLRTREILGLLDAARALDDHRLWIRRLIEEYYDPFYFSSLARRQPKILFRGSREAAQEFLAESLGR